MRQEPWGKMELLLVMRIDEPKFLVSYRKATLVYESFKQLYTCSAIFYVHLLFLSLHCMFLATTCIKGLTTSEWMEDGSKVCFCKSVDVPQKASAMLEIRQTAHLLFSEIFLGVQEKVLLSERVLSHHAIVLHHIYPLHCMKSQHTNVAWLQISEKYALASLILHSATSMPVTLQPNCAKGTKFPPSPQPTSKILLFDVSSVKSDK